MKRTLISAIILIFCASGIFAQTSRISYQGRLTDGSNEASGTYQMRFSLYDSVSGGTQIGQTVEITSVEVEGGVFSVTLDFGAAAFDGSDRYLQIEVRRNSGEAYVALAPRQSIDSAPYSVRAVNAQNADTLDGLDSSQFVTGSSNDFIRNGTALQSGADFNVGGTGRASILNADTEYRLFNRRVLSTPGSLSNLVIGVGAGNNISGAVATTLAGTGAGQNLTSGNFNSFFGSNAGLSNTSGFNNTFIGNDAGFANTTAENNVFIGSGAGADNNGPFNVFVGVSAGANNTTGRKNTFIGNIAGLTNNVGIENTFVGSGSGDANTSGNSNTFVGEASGTQVTTGDRNSFFGRRAGFNSTTGINNTFIGSTAGSVNATGSNNTMIGYDAETIGNDLNYATAIGADSRVSTSNTIQLGRPADRTIVSGELTVLAGEDTPVDRGNINFLTGAGNLNVYFQGGNGTKGINFGVDSGATNAKLFISQFDGTTYQDRIVVNETGAVEIRQLGSGGSTDVCRNSSNELATCSSSIRYKTGVTDFTSGLDVIRRLRPVFYKWKNGGMPDVGLVAEEVSEVEPLLTTGREGRVEGVKYDRLGVVLVNAVQEQQDEIEKQDTEIRRLRDENRRIRRTNERLGERVDAQTKLIEGLLRLVCADRPQEGICGERRTKPETLPAPTDVTDP